MTVYNHMDVQPAQEPEWKRAPFAFQNESGIYRGRGATDDKGPALAALFGARYAIEQGYPSTCDSCGNWKENGSPSFAATIKNRAAIPRPDSVVISDTIWLSEESACDALWTAGSARRAPPPAYRLQDAHSGVTGGAARNPLAS